MIEFKSIEGQQILKDYKELSSKLEREFELEYGAKMPWGGRAYHARVLCDVSDEEVIPYQWVVAESIEQGHDAIKWHTGNTPEFIEMEIKEHCQHEFMKLWSFV